MFFQMLNKFSCIALAGVATEYLLYGYAEGGLADVNTVNFLKFQVKLTHTYSKTGHVQVMCELGMKLT